MPNTLGNYDALFYASQALIHLRKRLGMAQRVHTGYDQERRVRDEGSVISIKRPGTFVAQKGSITTQNINSGVVNITLDQRPEVRFEVTDVEYAYTGEQLIRDHIAPAAYALADQIDQDLCALYKTIPWTYDYTTTTDHQVITGLIEIAFANKAPVNDGNWHLQVDGGMQKNFQNSNMFISADTAGQGNNQTLFNGSLGNRYGVEIYANQNAPTHTVGTVISGADQAGALTADLALGATSMAVGSLGATETLKAGDTFSIAGNTQRYAVAADVAMVGGAGTVTFGPPAVQAYSSGAVVTFYVTASGATQQLLYHRNAFAIAYATLPTDIPGLDIESVSDPVTGISIRASRGGDILNKKSIVSLDVLYGVQVLDPNLAVRGWT